MIDCARRRGGRPDAGAVGLGLEPHGDLGSGDLGMVCRGRAGLVGVGEVAATMSEERETWFQCWASSGVSESFQLGRLIVTLFLCLDIWAIGRSLPARAGARGYQFGPLQIDWDFRDRRRR